jgi:hypothetical protein
MESPGAWPSQDQGRGAWETIPPLLDRASPLCTAHLRIPVGPQIQFASESFINEIALHRARYCMSLSIVSGCWGGCRNRRHGRPFAC